MSEPAARLDRHHHQDDVVGSIGPYGIVGGDVVEAMSPTPEQVVDLGDGSLTLLALIATRDALSKQADELARRLQLYNRAITAWDQSGTLALPPPRLEPAHLDTAEPLLPVTGPAAKPRVEYPRYDQVPSMIVSVQLDEETHVESAIPADLLPETAKSRPRPPREAGTSTLRIATVLPPARTGRMWMMGVGLAFVGLTTWALLSVSAASSGESLRVSRMAAPAAATPVTSLPLLSSLASASVVAAPVEASIVALPGVSMSHFDVVWGDTSVRRLRAALKRATSRMETCFGQVPRDALAYPQKLSLSLRLRESGGITWVKGARSGVSVATQECIEGALHGTSFPSSRSGVLLNTELTFTPK